MAVAQKTKAEHGAALRVPPDHDTGGWIQLEWWLGDCGRRLDQPGCIAVRTGAGWRDAFPGDWIILSVSGQYFLAAGRKAVEG
jgi:hypothetical protein